MVSRVMGTVWDTKNLQFTESRHCVSVIELLAQHLEKKVASRRTGISSAKSSRDLAENVINDGVKGGGGRFVMGNRTPESFAEGAFSPGI